ncbi:hypothetical protein V6N12_047937 [Hibiscus sabdariffa]|uniref:Uncharacterized protein n=1 Tax=Hibiscus sabdariffa TaxID=183260 RepID=A0ABR2CUE7_9ROSI
MRDEVIGGIFTSKGGQNSSRKRYLAFQSFRFKSPLPLFRKYHHMKRYSLLSLTASSSAGQHLIYSFDSEVEFICCQCYFEYGTKGSYVSGEIISFRAVTMFDRSESAAGFNCTL